MKIQDRLKCFKYEVGRIAHRLHLASPEIIRHPKVILLMDGGICSQMNQYLLGHLYMKKGFHVQFDSTFFLKGCRDINNEFVRNFDLLKLFPRLPYESATPSEICYYKRHHYCSGNILPVQSDDISFLNKPPPLYLGGYYYLPPELQLKTFRELYVESPHSHSVLDHANQLMYEQIAQTPNSVAVHVRRGDLKKAIVAYGEPATNDYFQRAITHMKKKLNCPFFYFFSDEPEWVRQELMPKMGVSDSGKVVDINGSDKGYMDLLLISAASHQITSKGSLGKYGAAMSDNKCKNVILCDDESQYYWRDLFENPIFL